MVQMQGTFGLNLATSSWCVRERRSLAQQTTANAQRLRAIRARREMQMRLDSFCRAGRPRQRTGLTVACGLASLSPSLVPFEPEPTVGGAKRACVARGSSSSASRHRIRARSPVVRIGSTPYVYVGLSVRKIRGGSAWPSRDQLVASSSIIQIQSGCEILPKLTLNSQRLLPATQIKKILEQPWLTTTP